MSIWSTVWEEEVDLLNEKIKIAAESLEYEAQREADRLNEHPAARGCFKAEDTLVWQIAQGLRL